MLVLVLVAGGDVAGDEVRALGSSLASVLGAGAMIEVRAREAAGDRPAEAALAEVTWLDALHLEAALSVSLPGGRSIARRITFTGSDAPEERGRTLGLALASMLPVPTGDGDASPPPLDPPPAPAEHRTPPTEAAIEPAPRPEAPRFSVLAAGAASAPLGGAGVSFGGGVTGEWSLHDLVALRAVASVRFGEVASAQANLDVFTAGLGARVRLLDPAEQLPLGVAARVDLLAIHQGVSRFATGPASPSRERRDHWLPGAELGLEGSYFAGPTTELVLGVGAELAAGRAAILARAEEVAVLPPARLLLQLGLRASF